MKTFFKFDYYFQISFYFVSIIFLFSKSILFQDEKFMLQIPGSIGTVQIISYFLRIFLKSRKTLFFYFYGIVIIPFAIFAFSESLKFSYINFFDCWILIPIWGIFISPFMSAFYLFYCHETYMKL